MGLYLSYYIESVFINEASRKAFLAFIIIYTLPTYIPHLIAITAGTFLNEYNHVDSGKFCCKRVTLMVFSMFQAHYLFLVFGPRTEINVSFKDNMKAAYIGRCIA